MATITGRGRCHARTGMALALVIIAVFGIFADAHAAGCAPAKSKLEWQKGMCYTTWTKERYSAPGSDESLKELAATGTKWVALMVNWYQDKCYTTSMFRTEKTASDESVIHAIKTIHSLGMKVMLKPHLDLIDTSGGSWRGEIACATDPDWNLWFDSYAGFIGHYAQLAQEHKVEMLCIGTELTSVATIKEGLWREKIIKPVRASYKGLLTYAANWSEEYTHVKFWDAMDYVGIDAYFPLSDKDKPTFEEIKQAWGTWVKELEEFQAKVNKPIIFPEVGYCSVGGVAKMPWEELTSGGVDLQQQADCYAALFEVFWKKDWFYGVYWWRWGTDIRFGGPLNKGFSPQNKPALNVIKKWYNRQPPPRNKF